MFRFYMQPFFFVFLSFFFFNGIYIRFQPRDKAAIYSEVKTMHFFLRKICMKKRLESAFDYFIQHLCAYWGANWFATLTVKQWK